MKVNSFNKSDIAFNGFYNSKGLKKALKFAEHNGAMFTSITALVLSATFRPAIILATPNTDNENKKLACAKAITSSLLEAGMTLLISLPIVRGVSAINKNPQKYLKNETIKNLKECNHNLVDSKAYTLASQMFKLGVGIAVAIPKSLLNILFLPFINNRMFPQNEKSKTEEVNGNVTFKGNKEDFIAKIIGKTIDSEFVQNFSKKHKNSNFPMNINAFKDGIATLTFIIGTKNTNKIKEERKAPLIYNSAISTSLSILSGYCIDSITKKPAEKFIEKLSTANKNDSNLKKYIDGFKIAKPVIIMGVVYYILIPLISTFFADRIDKKLSGKT